MYASYAGIVAFTIIALIFPIMSLFAARFGAPKQTDAAPTSRRGIAAVFAPTTVTAERFLVTVVWTAVGVLVLTVIPWAFAARSFSTFTLVELVIALVILAVGLVYAWRKGILQQPTRADTAQTEPTE